jgi:energy-coupling factor transporter ATP-binding protein EcfA2
MAIDDHHAKFNRLVTGPSGSGKTTLTLEMLAAEPARRKVLFDSKCDIARKLPGVPVTKSPDELLALAASRPVVVFQFGDKWPDGLSAFRWFWAALYAMSARWPGRTLACCDELQQFVPQGPQSLVPVEFMRVLELARCRQLDILCACQSANRVNTAIRAQLTELVTFRQNEKEALKFTKGFGIPDREVNALGKHQWLMRNADTGTVTLGGPKTAVRDAEAVVNLRGAGKGKR